MKIKTLVAMLFLSAGATTVVAQDASNCNSNSSISHEAVRAGNFKDAYTPWKAVLENCPTLRFYTFTDGYKILKGLMAQIKDKNNPEYQKYFDELMNTHDLRMKYTEEFLAKGTKVSSADEALGIKAVDYIALAPKVDANQAYQWLSQSVNAVKGESAAATLFYFLQMSLDKLKLILIIKNNLFRIICLLQNMLTLLLLQKLMKQKRKTLWVSKITSWLCS